VHLKFAEHVAGGAPHACRPVLPGQGDFPAVDVLCALHQAGYDDYISFEWERKWHAEIEPADVALPAFIRWWREQGITASTEV
jgi:sugar phosphate isomerase/epimerase